MTEDPAIITGMAVDWHLRQRDLSGDDWLRFVDWLEADPAHARAYDLVATADRALGGVRHVLPAPVVVVHSGTRRHRRWAWAVWAMAASVAALLALPLLRTAARPYAVETHAGELRTVVLADATRIELNGATRLVLDRSDARMATLERGEAVFHVRHDAARPFTLRAGGRTIEDLGTVFDVARVGDRVEVAVAQGSVAFDPGHAATVLRAGDALAASGDAVSIGQVAPDSVGGWRTGRLSYRGAALASVAAALERRYGTPVALAAGLSGRPFTGTIALSGSAERDIPHLAALIGVEWRRDGQQWVLGSGAATP